MASRAIILNLFFSVNVSVAKHYIVFHGMLSFLFLPCFCHFTSLWICLPLHRSVNLAIYSGNICHFSCHLNHPSIRPSIFQATHLAHPSFIHLSVLSIVQWDAVVIVAVILAFFWRNTVTDFKQKMGECLHAFTQIIHTCVPHSMPKRKERCSFPHVFFQPAHARCNSAAKQDTQRLLRVSAQHQQVV